MALPCPARSPGCQIRLNVDEYSPNLWPCSLQAGDLWDPTSFLTYRQGMISLLAQMTLCRNYLREGTALRYLLLFLLPGATAFPPPSPALKDLNAFGHRSQRVACPETNLGRPCFSPWLSYSYKGVRYSRRSFLPYEVDKFRFSSSVPRSTPSRPRR